MNRPAAGQTEQIKSDSTSVWNIPNRISAARLVVTVAAIIAIHFHFFGWALVLFCVAAGTDFLDGYLARAWNQVTQLGRILDPLADKVLISGAFIYLASIPESGIPPWLAVVVICRELVVTVIRSLLEQQGHDFSANMPGKLKMVFQCAAVIASLLVLWQGEEATAGVRTVLSACVWLTLLFTVYSGIIYAFAAARMVRNS